MTHRLDWMPSLIWLIPLIAALVGTTLVALVLLNRSPRVEVSFRMADGLEAGKTAVKSKDVQIGVVQSLRLARDRSRVRVVLQLDKDADGFTAQDTRFWVVRPGRDTTWISGLGTPLSGAYIGADAGTSNGRSRAFAGLEAPPVVTPDASGTQFLVHADDIGSLDVGSPVFFRRIKVGHICDHEINSDGCGSMLRVFVNAPYDKFVSTDTCFWHASGFDPKRISRGAGPGTQSPASVLLWGLGFRAPGDVIGPAAQENTLFVLAGDEPGYKK